MRVAVHGNCQSSAIADLLREACPNWEVTAFPVHLIKLGHELQAYENYMISADIVLAQPVSAGYRNCPSLSLDWVRSAMQPGARLVIYPVIYFQGHHPFEAGLAVGDEVLPGYRFESWNIALVQGYLAGLSCEESTLRALDPHLVAPASLEELARSSIEALRERELRFETDIRISDFIARHHRHVQLFHTVNHPHRPVTAHVVNAALALLGSNKRVAHSGPDPMGWSHIPVPPCLQFLTAPDADLDGWAFADAAFYRLDSGAQLSRLDYMTEAWPRLAVFDRDRLSLALSVHAERLAMFDLPVSPMDRVRQREAEAPALHAPGPPRPALPLQFDINHVLSYGQSLSNGWVGWPALSTKQRFDNLMLGQSVRAMSEVSNRFVPVGEVAFKPLHATVQNVHHGGLLTSAEAALLPEDACAMGETILEGALNFWRSRMQKSLDIDVRHRRLLGTACGVGGQPMEALALQTSPCLFDRVRDAIRLARTVSEAQGLTYGVAGFALLHGEGNNWGMGGTSDRQAYIQLLQDLRNAIEAELLGKVAGQKLMVPLFLHQTGAAYSTIENNIPQAQLEFCRKTPGCHLVAPIYPLIESYGGHLDANGYRWLGAQFGKVMHKVITLGEAWKPLHLVASHVKGAELTMDFHVPVPPLVWQDPIAGHAPIQIPDRGFEVFDATGEIGISSVELVSATEVVLRLTRPCGSDAQVRYAGARRAGRGCLRDSDPDHSEDCFIFLAPDSGGLPRQVAGFTESPYPLTNWCVAFTHPIT